MSALPILTILKDGETIKSQPIENEIMVGRGESCVVRLEDRAVSRQHATFRAVPEGIRVDKKSEFAPLKINGAESTGAVVREGDVIEIGPYLAKIAYPKPVSKTPEVSTESLDTPSSPSKDRDVMLDIDAIAAGESQTAPVESIEGLSPLEVDMTGAIERPASEKEAGSDLELPSGDEIGLAIDDNLPFEPAPDAGLNLDFGSDSNQTGNEKKSESFGSGAEMMELEAPADAGASTSQDSEPLEGENSKTKIIPSDLVAQLVIENGQANVDAIDLDKDQILIGRGKECEVVINDKKASRKNTVIVREGNHYVIRDLGSSNGTYVNGEKVQERKLEADDKIDVGDVRFRFVAKSAMYEEQEKDFVSVPTLSDVPMPSAHSFETGEADPGVSSALSADNSQAASLPSTLPEHLMGQDSNLGIGADPLNAEGVDPAQAAQAEQKQSPISKIYIKYVRNFKDLKPVQKLLVVLVAFLFFSWYLEEDQVAPPQTKPVNQQTAGGVKTFENLTPDQQRAVQAQYDRAYAAFVKQDFDNAIHEVRKIYAILPEYEKAKELERYANEGKRRFLAKEEERKKKEEEAKLRARVAELADEARVLMEAKKFPEAEEKFPEILSIDPENEQVASWKQEIEAYNEEQKRIEQEKAVQAAVNQRAWDIFKEGQALYKKGSFRSAIQTFESVFELGADDQKVLSKTKSMIVAAKNSIRDLRDPILVKAKSKESEGELAAAFRLYEKAMEIDPDHPVAPMGMERIRGTLQDRAKIMYTEAIVAESYSDFDTAYTKFNKILKTAPEGSLYYERAQRKLAAYFHYQPKGGSVSEDEESESIDRSTASEEMSGETQ